MARQLPTRKSFLTDGILEDVKCALCKKPFDAVHKVARIRTATHDCHYVFGSACLYDHFAHRTSNQCPECNVPLFTMPRIPNFKTGTRPGTNIPAESWDQGPSNAHALNTIDQFNFRVAQDFVAIVWYNMNKLYPNNEIYESDIEGKITEALETVRAFETGIFTRPLIKSEHCGPIKQVMREMIKVQFENCGEDNLSDNEVHGVWMPKMMVALGWTF